MTLGGSHTGSGGTAPLSYLWSPDVCLDDETSPNPTANPMVPTMYTVTVTDDVREGVVFLWTGAWYDPDVADPQRLDRHGNPNVLTHDLRTSRLAQGPAAQSALVEIRKYEGPAPRMQAFEPPQFFASGTLGGMVSAGLSGPARPWCGSVRDAVLGVQMINGLGERLTFGGQVMKNVAGYDISRLMTGAFGAAVSIRVCASGATGGSSMLPAPSCARVKKV